jgi:putative addiction module killer protein
MLKIVKSQEFDAWLSKLKDRQAIQRILARIDRVRLGNFGDSKFLRDGVSELRIDWAAGYRLYYTQRNGVMVILLCGGDKSTQSKDINRAIELAHTWSES